MKPFKTVGAAQLSIPLGKITFLTHNCTIQLRYIIAVIICFHLNQRKTHSETFKQLILKPLILTQFYYIYTSSL